MTAFATCFISTRSWLSSIVRYAILIGMLPIPPLTAQVLQTARYELPLIQQERHIETIPAGKGGLFLYRVYLGAKDDILQLIKVDTAFAEEWSGYIHIDKDYLIMGRKSFQDKLYLLLRYHDYSKNDFVIFAIDEHTGHYIRYVVRGIIPMAPTEFHVTAEGALIGGYYNRVPVVIFYSFAKMTSRILPGLFNEVGELTQLKTYEDGTFDVLISARNFRKQRTIWIKNYDTSGHLISNTPLAPNHHQHLIFGRAIKTPNHQRLVAGVYGTADAEYSRGLFIALLDRRGNEHVRYYNFADLENFFNYMKAKRQQRIRSRIERRKVRGKTTRFNYRFLVHELIPYQGNYILLGEAFYPKYRYPSNAYGAYGQGFARVFDGYVYTHAVILCFDANGNLLWDNSFEINDVKTFSLEQFVKIEAHDDKIVLFYVFDHAIRTKVIDGSEVLEGKSIDPISIFSDQEVVAKELSDHGRLEYWYDNNLYAYGVQEIVGKNGRQTPKRRVFYVNKVTFADGVRK